MIPFNRLGVMAGLCLLPLLWCSCVSPGGPQGRHPQAGSPDTPARSSKPMVHRNAEGNFSVAIPGDWDRIAGDIDSKSALFIMPGKTCRFEFHLEPVDPETDPVTSVSMGLEKAREDIAAGRLISAERRDDHGTRGWEEVERGTPGGQQRIIYHCYDTANRYYNFMGAGETEQFESCRPILRKILDSIKFGD